MAIWSQMTVLGHYVYGERGNESLEKQFQIKWNRAALSYKQQKANA